MCNTCTYMSMHGLQLLAELSPELLGPHIRQQSPSSTSFSRLVPIKRWIDASDDDLDAAVSTGSIFMWIRRDTMTDSHAVDRGTVPNGGLLTLSDVGRRPWRESGVLLGTLQKENSDRDNLIEYRRVIRLETLSL